jgi:hypothetical protein
MDVITWLNATAEYMAQDRADIYDKESAVADLSDQMETLREYDLPISVVSFASYILVRLQEFGPDESMEEFILSKKVASLNLFLPEEECSAWAHTDGINLPHILDDDPDGMLD